MSSPSWLPPLNSHENYKTIILAAQSKEPMIDESCLEKIFLIRVDVDVSFYSHSNELALKGLSLSEEFPFSCCSLTCSSQEQVKKVVSDMLCQMHIPFQLDHIFFTHRHLKRTSNPSLCNKLLPEDADSWIENLQNFLCAMRSESYNAICDVLPLSLKIKKNVWISDNEFQSWRSWYNEKKRVDPSFHKIYQAAICRPRTIQELLDEESLKFKAADKSSLAALQDVRIDDDSGSAMQCLVCLEEFALGLIACQLPCSHVFHKVCIIKWLQEAICVHCAALHFAEFSSI